MQVNNLKTQKGFTLVEIAIVLVIIGLLLGGVLKGQELITNAKIKSVTQDFEGISAAYYAYQDRTGNIPGDSTTTDGAIDSDDAFWFDLKTEGFISGDVGLIGNSDGPAHDLSGIWVAVDGDADSTAAMFTTNHICADNIPDNFAAGMDAKLDDGVANTGSIRSGTTIAAATAVVETTAPKGYTSTEALYFVCKAL